ncbi:MAG: hypothetical protein AMJ64_00800 [Betaproteobacteria bacterium SG8_39]|nr:MAG: hypothetical protein AMJ64_00800 [Betaproteobacteria bacterium SG8_39]
MQNTKKLSDAPPWLLRLLTPLLARHVARQMAKEDPGASAAALGKRMRADLGARPDPAALRLVEAVERQLAVQLPGARAVPAVAPGVSAIVLLAANLFPLYGVAALGWSVFDVLLLFWVENVIVGLLNVARMVFASPDDPLQWGAKLLFVPFFCVHYGMFTAVHGAFVFGMFGQRKTTRLFEPEAWLDTIGAQGLWLAVGVLAASHLFSFFWNYIGRGEYRAASAPALMGKPYGRVVVLHLTIIFGGMGVQALGSPLWALVLLVVLKTGIDLAAHLREHRGAAARRKTSA